MGGGLFQRKSSFIHAVDGLDFEIRMGHSLGLVGEPAFVAADEPTSMLDVSIRTSVMQLMLELGGRMGVSYLHITHDLAAARYMCQEITVMDLGKIVEQTQSIEIEGDITRPIDPASWCRFYERCPAAADVCARSEHPILEDKGGGHRVACHMI